NDRESLLLLLKYRIVSLSYNIFFLITTATPVIYTLSLHDALPIFYCSRCVYYGKHQSFQATAGFRDYAPNAYSSSNGWSDWCFRSEERFSRNAETDLVCRLLLEKKKRGLRAYRHRTLHQRTGCDRP